MFSIFTTSLMILYFLCLRVTMSALAAAFYVRRRLVDKKAMRFCACIFFASTQVVQLSVAAVNEEELAQVLLQKADQIRFPREGFQVDVNIKSTGLGREPDIRKYRILAKGNENTVIMITEPA